MKTFCKFSLLILIFVGFDARAGNCPAGSPGLCQNLIVTQILVQNTTDAAGALIPRVTLAVDTTIIGSCTMGERSLRLDIDDASKEAVYSALLTFVSQREKISIWFTESPVAVQGTTNTTGCSTNALAEVKYISASFAVSEFDGDTSLQGDEPPLD